MRSQLNEKKMLLEHFYNVSLQIYNLFSKNEINEAISLISRKDTIIKNLSLLKNVQDASLDELKQKIKLQEEKNIELAISLRDSIEKELKLCNKNAKMNRIYNNTITQGNIVDILE